LNEVLEIVAAILTSEEEPTELPRIRLGPSRSSSSSRLEEGTWRARTISVSPSDDRGPARRDPQGIRGLAEQVVRRSDAPAPRAIRADLLNAQPRAGSRGFSPISRADRATAAGAICDLLGQVNHMKHRRCLCEALAISCKDDVDVLISRLGDSRWYVIRNVV